MTNQFEKIEEQITAAAGATWRQVVERPETPLFHSYTDASNYEHFEEVFGLPWQATGCIWLNHKIYWLEDELVELETLLRQEAKVNSNFFVQFRNQVLAVVNQLETTANEIQSHFDQPLNLNIPELFREYDRAATRAWSTLLVVALSDKILSELIKTELGRYYQTAQELEKDFKVLTYPTKENIHAEEVMSLYNLAEIVQAVPGLLDQRLAMDLKSWEATLCDQPTVAKPLKDHLERFAWIGARNLWDTAWTERDITDRLYPLVAESIPVKRQSLTALRQEYQDLRQSIEQKLGLSADNNLASLLETAREYAHLRTHRTDAIHRAGYRVKPLLTAVGRLFQLDYASIVLCSRNEILDGLIHGSLPVNQQQIVERSQEFATLFWQGSFAVFSGGDISQLYQVIPQPIVLQQEIRGQIAYPGKVSGVARVIRHQRELSSVREGDILIAPMTFPNYVPAMERAAAFVTDEGGILCHAAIISREMKKPCLIGTKNATHQFTNGETIVVDALEGRAYRAD